MLRLLPRHFPGLGLAARQYQVSLSNPPIKAIVVIRLKGGGFDGLR